MEVRMYRWSSDSFLDHGHQLAMIENAHVELFWTRLLRFFIEGHIYSDRPFGPAAKSIILPINLLFWVLTVFPAELRINESPIFFCNIFWTKLWMPNYLEKILKA